MVYRAFNKIFNTGQELKAVSIQCPVEGNIIIMPCGEGNVRFARSAYEAGPGGI